MDEKRLTAGSLSNDDHNLMASTVRRLTISHAE
jgi:hypothetical protein